MLKTLDLFNFEKKKKEFIINACFYDQEHV